MCTTTAFTRPKHRSLPNSFLRKYAADWNQWIKRLTNYYHGTTNWKLQKVYPSPQWLSGWKLRRTGTKLMYMYSLLITQVLLFEPSAVRSTALMTRWCGIVSRARLGTTWSLMYINVPCSGQETPLTSLLQSVHPGKKGSHSKNTKCVGKFVVLKLLLYHSGRK